MIRVFSLLCKLNSIKLSDKSIFDLCLSRSDLRRSACPCCGSTGIHAYHSSYTRTMITFTGGKRDEFTVSIPRIRCSCGHTHAIIPDVLVPYSSYSLRFILIILIKYMRRSCSVASICDKYHISQSTLYEWIHLFLEHYNLWVGAIDEISHISISAIRLIEDFPCFPAEFYSIHRFSFMQYGYLTTHSGNT